MYISNLDGGKPVIFKPVYSLNPPDCGGKDYDEVDYAPFCPECGRRFYSLEYDKYCRDCGTKLYWKVKWPKFLKDVTD